MQPVIGKLSQVGAERILGTILGGVIGYGVYEAGEKYWERRCILSRKHLKRCWIMRIAMMPRVICPRAFGSQSAEKHLSMAMRSDTRRDDGIALSFCAFGMAFLGVWGGARLKLDYSGAYWLS